MTFQFRSTPLYEETGISIALVAIAKDEIHIIEEMFKSMLPYINCYFIADTGSTDGTQSFIKAWMKKNRVPGKLVEYPFKDFGQARSELMRRCTRWGRKRNVNYVFMMDADDVLRGKLPIDVLKGLADSYILCLRSGATNYKRQQIFSLLGNNWSYKGAVHEYASTDNPFYRPQHIEGDYYIDSRRLGSRNKDQTAKNRRDVNMLLGDLEKNPECSRSAFYLALAYYYLGEWDQAIKWFCKRIEKRHFWEEEWWSFLKMAECFEKRQWEGDHDKSQGLLWKMMDEFPKRAEQCFDLSRSFEKDEKYQVAFDIAAHGMNIPRPTDNLLWFLEEVYDYWLPWQYFYMAYKSKNYESVLEIAPILNHSWHQEHKTLHVNHMVRDACKKLRHRNEFIDYPLYDPNFSIQDLKNLDKKKDGLLAMNAAAANAANSMRQLLSDASFWMPSFTPPSSWLPVIPCV